MGSGCFIGWGILQGTLAENLATDQALSVSHERLIESREGGIEAKDRAKRAEDRAAAAEARNDALVGELIRATRPQAMQDSAEL